MGVKEDFFQGLSSYREAHQVIVKHRLFRYVWIPGIITLIYTLGFFRIAYSISATIEKSASAYPGWLNWMGDFTYWFLEGLYWVVAILVFFASIKYVLQVALAPVLSNLSAAIEKLLGGQEPEAMSWSEVFHDIWRSLKLSLRNIVLELFFGILLSFIPILGQIAAFFVSSYYSGFGYMDFVLERKKMTVSEASAFGRKHRALLTGIGTINNLVMLIPVLGWFVAPAYATVAATIETLRILNPEDKARMDAFVLKSEPQ